MGDRSVVPDIDSVLGATDQKSPSRCCFLLRVRTDRLAEYLDVHQRVWPEMRDALTESGWRNYSLFVQPGTGMVVGYFEADDVAAAQESMASLEVDSRWQATMAEYFVAPGGGSNEVLPQYFYLA